MREFNVFKRRLHETFSIISQVYTKFTVFRSEPIEKGHSNGLLMVRRFDAKREEGCIHGKVAFQ
jgi:hypothetical protein